jgi:hypothetical protein
MDIISLSLLFYTGVELGLSHIKGRTQTEGENGGMKWQEAGENCLMSFIFVLFTKYYGEQTDEMGRAGHVARMGR